MSNQTEVQVHTDECQWWLDGEADNQCICESIPAGPLAPAAMPTKAESPEPTGSNEVVRSVEEAPAKMSAHSVSADGRGVSRNWDETLNPATGEIGHYVLDGDDTKFHFEASTESLVAAKLKEKGGNIDKWTYQVQGLLKSRATDRDTVFPQVTKSTKYDESKTWVVPQGVALDISENSEEERLGRNWGLPVPHIHFCELKPSDSIYVEGKAECVAIGWDPDQCTGIEAGTGKVLSRNITWNGVQETVQSDWDRTGYVGIVRTFSGYGEMVSARERLVQALRTIRQPVPTDTEPDPFAENAHLDEVDNDRMYDEDMSL